MEFFFAGVASREQYVYVVGGYDSTVQLPSVERYDIDTNQWEFVAPMNRPRSALGVAVINNKLYALGKVTTLTAVPFLKDTTDFKCYIQAFKDGRNVIFGGFCE